jgi:ankyrin repeat protein
MRQPNALKTDEYVPWSKGKGQQVWAMICAVVEGSLDKVENLVQMDRTLLTCEYEYFTPMHFAARENHKHIIEFLLNENVDTVYSPGEPLLTTAEDREYSELTAFLKDVLKTRYHVTPKGTIIAEAIRNGAIDDVKKIIEDGASVTEADDKGNQPIHWAAFTGNIELLDYLLAHGAEINAVRPDGARPVDLANIYLRNRTWYIANNTDLFAKNNNLLKLLFERGAYCDIGTAARIGRYDLVKEMVEANPETINAGPFYSDYFSGLPLRMAAGAGHLSIVEFLLKHGANPNQSEPGVAPGGGALHAAIWGRHFEIAEVLLKHGAHVDAEVESSGDSIFMAEWVNAPQEFIATLKKHSKKVLKKLLEGGLDGFKALVASNAHSAMSFIDYFIREDLRDYITVLLESQADILRHRDNDPAAWWDSFTFKSAESARWLLDRGLPVNRSNWLGITPLHRAAGSGDIVIAELLLSYGADINAVETEWCSTPLGWAAKQGQKTMVEWLLKNGADINAKGQKNWSRPTSWAVRKGFDEISSLLTN